MEFLGVIGLIVAIVALIKGSIPKLKIMNRKVAVVVLVVSFAFISIGSDSPKEITAPTEQEEQEEMAEEESLSTNLEDFDTEAPLKLTQEILDKFTNNFSSPINLVLEESKATIWLAGNYADFIDAYPENELFKEENFEFIISLSGNETMTKVPVYLLSKFPELKEVEIKLEGIFDKSFFVKMNREKMKDIFGLEGHEVRSKEQRQNLRTSEEEYKQLISNYDEWAVVQQKGFEQAIALEAQELKENAVEISYRELARDADELVYTDVKMTGQILALQEGNGITQIRLMPEKGAFGYDYNKLVYIEYEGYTDYYDDDIITIYGYVYGYITYDAIAGEITLPAIVAEIIE